MKRVILLHYLILEYAWKTIKKEAIELIIRLNVQVRILRAFRSAQVGLGGVEGEVEVTPAVSPTTGLQLLNNNDPSSPAELGRHDDRSVTMISALEEIILVSNSWSHFNKPVICNYYNDSLFFGGGRTEMR